MFSRMPKELLLTVAVGGIVTALLVMLAWHEVRHNEDKIFELESWLIKETLSESVNSSDAVAKSMQALFHSSQHVDADQFRVFSKEIFSRYSFIRSAEYYPRIYLQERQEFEEEQRDWGFITFRIFEYNEKQKKKSAAKRDIYFPVIYKQPFSPEDASLIGYDILSDPDLMESIWKAVETGGPILSAHVERKDGLSREYKLFIAVYEGKQLPGTEKARKQKVNGLISFSIYPEAMVGIERLPPYISVKLDILSPEAEAGISELLQYSPEISEHQSESPVSILSVEHNIRVSEQQFRLTVSKFLYFGELNLWLVVVAFAAGLGVSAGFFVILRARRNLKKELAERRRAQQELAKHRDHLEELVKKRTAELEKKTIDLEQANIRLKELDRLKSTFLASMSHELRTPLNSIIGFTGIILQGMAGDVNEEQRKQLTMVKNSASHLLNLIDDVLDISNIEAGRLELSLEEFGLNDVVSEVVKTLSPAASEKSMETEMQSIVDHFSGQIKAESGWGRRVSLHFHCL